MMTSPLGLPRSAWLNSPQYAQTSFPAAPVISQRCYRTDVNGGTWYTWNGTTWVADGGSSSVGTAFPGSPTVGQRFLRTDLNGWWTYVTVSGSPYWVPDAGTLVCSIIQASPYTTVAVSSIGTVMTNMSTVVKNTTTTSAWYNTGSSRFTPPVPGWYMIGGGISFAVNGADSMSIRHAFLTKNGAYVPGSFGSVTPTNMQISNVAVRNSTIYINPGDYVDLWGRHNNIASVATTSADSTGQNTSFWAQYLNPFA